MLLLTHREKKWNLTTKVALISKISAMGRSMMLTGGQTTHYLHCNIFKEGIRLVRQKEHDKSFHVTRGGCSMAGE